MPRKRLKMSSSREIRQAVTRVANMVLNGTLDPKSANAILYAANVNLGAIRVDEQGRRIEELEKIVSRLEEGGGDSF